MHFSSSLPSPKDGYFFCLLLKRKKEIINNSMVLIFYFPWLKSLNFSLISFFISKLLVSALQETKKLLLLVCFRCNGIVLFSLRYPFHIVHQQTLLTDPSFVPSLLKSTARKRKTIVVQERNKAINNATIIGRAYSKVTELVAIQ